MPGKMISYWFSSKMGINCLDKEKSLKTNAIKVILSETLIFETDENWKFSVRLFLTIVWNLVITNSVVNEHSVITNRF
jgi:hypothetical protein